MEPHDSRIWDISAKMNQPHARDYILSLLFLGLLHFGKYFHWRAVTSESRVRSETIVTQKRQYAHKHTRSLSVSLRVWTYLVKRCDTIPFKWLHSQKYIVELAKVSAFIGWFDQTRFHNTWYDVFDTNGIWLFAVYMKHYYSLNRCNFSWPPI